MLDKKVVRVWSRLGNRVKGSPHTYYSQEVGVGRLSKKYRPVPLPEEIENYRFYLHPSAVDKHLYLTNDPFEENVARHLSSGKEVQVMGYHWSGSPDANLKVRLACGNVTNVMFNHLIWKRKPKVKFLRSYRVK